MKKIFALFLVFLFVNTAFAQKIQTPSQDTSNHPILYVVQTKPATAKPITTVSAITVTKTYRLYRSDSVSIDSTVVMKITCPPGYRFDPATGNCVKVPITEIIDAISVPVMINHWEYPGNLTDYYRDELYKNKRGSHQ